MLAEKMRNTSLNPRGVQKRCNFFFGGLYLLFVMIGEITFPRNTIFSQVFGSIRPIQGSNWADWFSWLQSGSSLWEISTENNKQQDWHTLLSIIFLTQKTTHPSWRFGGDFWISLQEVISVNYHLNQDYHDLCRRLCIRFSGSMAIWWIKIFACPEKKQPNMAAILASPPEARAKAGARGNWFFRVGFISKEKW